MALAKMLLLVAMMAIAIEEIYGHGMMMDPVSRSSAWRKGFKTPPNYTDNELFCGGWQAHHTTNRGRCGECGDNFSHARPRANDNGGTYGTGTIVKTYNRGQTATVEVKLSANHYGTFRFWVCPLQHSKELETEPCFDKYPLKLADGSDAYKIQSTSQRDFKIPVVLPSGLSCKHCVFRWEYRAANNWGKCADGTSGLGCGPQETFRNCADITIN